MSLELARALAVRGRRWGQHNTAVLELMRSGKSRDLRWPIRPCLALGGGGYLTRIPTSP